jgi:hypothetical protein
MRLRDLWRLLCRLPIRDPWHFPTQEPRAGRIWWDGEQTAAELLKQLKPGQQPKAKS